MKKLNQYMQEVEQDLPQVGDVFIFESEEGELVESHIIEIQEDGIVVASDQQAEALLSLDGYLLEAIARYGAVGTSPGMGYSQNEDADMGPGDHLDRIENGQLGDNSALAEEEPTPPDANHNDPLLSKAVDDAAVPAMESDDLVERLLQLANVAEAGSWIGKDTDKPAHLRKAEYEKSMGSASAATKFRVPGDPSTPAAQRKIRPGDAQDKKPTTAEEHELSELRRHAGIMEDPTEEESMPQQSAVASEPQSSQSSEPGSAAAKAFEGESNTAESPVAQAIVGRIVRAHTDLLAKHGPEKVGDAVDRVARSVGKVEEIGSSDVSGWVREVEQELQMGESLEEMRRRSGLGSRRGRGLDDYEKMWRQRDQYWNQSAPPDESEFKNRDEEDDPNYRRQQRDKFKNIKEHNVEEAIGDPFDPEQKGLTPDQRPGYQDQYDDQATYKYALEIANAIKKDTGATVAINAGRQAGDQRGTYQIVINPQPNDRSKGFLPAGDQGATPQNVTKAIAQWFRTFRSKGWRFDQPVQGQFIIGVPKSSGVAEAEYQGRDVPLGKPMQGDVKKFKVYVKDPKTGNVKKVNFGDKTMRIKKSNPARRKSFRARHNCDNPGPRTKARYWSCRKW